MAPLRAVLTGLKNHSKQSTLPAVRRILAILLMAVFSFPLIGPALLASDTDSNLPACCRRSGSHQCSIMARRSPAAGPAVEAGKCVSFPVTTVFPGNPTAGSPGISQVDFGGLIGHSASRPQAEALCRISYSRAGQKRGPPTFLS